MEPRLTMVTLGVSDLPRARAFYSGTLGWKPAPQSGGDVVFFQAGGVVLGLYPRALLAEDAQVADAGAEGFGGVTLAQNVRERDDVDRVLAEVEAAGARILKPAQDTFWGGRSGYFADPDGNPWEVAWGPTLPVDEEGILRLVPPPARKSPRRKGSAGKRTRGAGRVRRPARRTTR